MSKVFEARFEFDKNRAAQIAKRLYEQFYGGKGFFAGYKMPEYVLPRNLVPGSKEHAQYLTSVISIDYMTDAVKLWRNAREPTSYILSVSIPWRSCPWLRVLCRRSLPDGHPMGTVPRRL